MGGFPTFYESGELSTAPFLEIPAHQYGGLPCNPARNNYTLLEALRPFYEGPFSLQSIVVPRATALLSNSPTGVAALQQVEDRVQLPADSWLLGFSAYSAQAAGFRFSLFDVGANDYALNESFESNKAGAQDNTDSDPAVPHILPEPYCLISSAGPGSPGILQVELVNSAAVNNDCQLVLHFAVLSGKVK